MIPSILYSLPYLHFQPGNPQENLQCEITSASKAFTMRVWINGLKSNKTRLVMIITYHRKSIENPV
jgi:hypothetical protein